MMMSEKGVRLLRPYATGIYRSGRETLQVKQFSGCVSLQVLVPLEARLTDTVILGPFRKVSLHALDHKIVRKTVHIVELVGYFHFTQGTRYLFHQRVPFYFTCSFYRWRIQTARTAGTSRSGPSRAGR